MSLNDLKQELLNQKQAILSKFGTVTVANTNPSPSEITSGINSIPAINTSLATATEADVLAGKKFYSKNTTLKTGTATDLSNQYLSIYFYSDGVSDFTTRVTYNTPSSISRVKSHLFHSCYNPIDVYFSSNITAVGNYSFADTPNFKFYNFSSNTYITTLGEGAFYNAGHTGIDFSHLPTNLTTIGDKCFADTLVAGDNLVIPSSVTSCGDYAFACMNDRQTVGTFTLNSTLGGELPTGMLMGLDFNCDFVVPSGITKINKDFNYRGSFNNITIPASVTNMCDACFGGPSGDSQANYHLNSVVFLGTTPPTFGENVFAIQNLLNPNFKIYVPDSAVEAYKSAGAFGSTYGNFIFPVSQRP